MDYEISVPTLSSKTAEFDGMSNTIQNITEEYGSGYLKQISSTEVGPVIGKITESVTRLNKGYKNSATWFKKYVTDLKALEDSLASFSSTSLKSPTAFTGEFMDIFTKITIPAIKTGADETINYSLAPIYIGEHLISFNYNGERYIIVNTKIPVEQYAEYIQKNGLYQNAGLLGGQCMLLSQYYASDMLSGKYSSKNTMATHSGAPAVKMNEGAVSANEQDVLNYVYSEINEGNPVVLQVSQKMSYLGLRHLVTVVGYSSDVKSAADLTPDKILVLDCVDGKIQTLSERNRRLYNQNNHYLAYGPTERFKASIS